MYSYNSPDIIHEKISRIHPRMMYRRKKNIFMSSTYRISVWHHVLLGDNCLWFQLDFFFPYALALLEWNKKQNQPTLHTGTVHNVLLSTHISDPMKFLRSFCVHKKKTTTKPPSTPSQAEKCVKRLEFFSHSHCGGTWVVQSGGFIFENRIGFVVIDLHHRLVFFFLFHLFLSTQCPRRTNLYEKFKKNKCKKLYITIVQKVPSCA